MYRNSAIGSAGGAKLLDFHSMFVVSLNWRASIRLLYVNIEAPTTTVYTRYCEALHMIRDTLSIVHGVGKR